MGTMVTTWFLTWGGLNPSSFPARRSFALIRKRMGMPMYAYPSETGLVLSGFTELLRKHFVSGKTSVERQVNHKNGVKNDNKASNLEWCSSSENRLHAYRNELQKACCGERHHASVLTRREVIEIRSLIESKEITQRQIAKRFGVVASCITKIKKRDLWASV